MPASDVILPGLIFICDEWHYRVWLSSNCTFWNWRIDSINKTTLQALFIELARITREPYTEHTHSSLSESLEVCILPKKKCPGFLFLLMKESSTKKCIFSLNLKWMQNSSEYLVWKFLNHLYWNYVNFSSSDFLCLKGNRQTSHSQSKRWFKQNTTTSTTWKCMQCLSAVIHL